MDWIMMVLQIVYPLVMTGIAVSAVFFKTGKLVNTLETLQKTSEDEDARLSSRLDGIERFLPDLVIKDGCDKRHQELEARICRKIDEVKHAVEIMETRRQEAGVINEARWNDIFQAVGRLQGQAQGPAPTNPVGATPRGRPDK